MAASSENNLLDQDSPAITCSTEQDHDHEFDILHPPFSEDEADQTTPQDEAFPMIPFSRVHDIPFGFNHPEKSLLIPRCAIQLEISNVERSTSTHFLNPNLYVIQLQHGEYQWVIKRRYKHFHHLHQQLQLFRASLVLPFPTKKHRERRRSCPTSERKNLPKFPKLPDALISQDDVPRRREQLQQYLRNLLSIPIYRKHHETLQFLEISPLSFIHGLGGKFKEGWIKKRSGGQRATVGCLKLKRAFISFFGMWGKRWFVVKDNFVALIRPSDGAIRTVLLLDNGTQVDQGLMEMGIYNGIQFSNLSRHLLIKCWTKRKVREWAQALRDAAKTTGRDFTQPNRFDSFAPVREHVNCSWFVDGATYYEAVAEALEAAKEEIFITDWWLSPEIYLKRPIIQGETWRLDHVLRRKAQQGVKVFVMMYKEVEVSLGINSFYSKKQLVNMHPNIKVLRHPDHIKGGVLLWSHHEKIVVVDQIYGFLGGLDLCFGRWDDYQHRLTDLGGVGLTRKSQSVEALSKEKAVKLESSPNGIESQEVEEVEERDTADESIGQPSPECTTPQIIISEVDSGDATPTHKKYKKRWHHLHWKLQGHESPEEVHSDGETSRPSFQRGKTKRMIQAVARFQNLKRHLRRHSLESVDSLNMGATWDSLDIPVKELQRSVSERELNALGILGSAKLWFGKDYTNFIVKDFVDLDDPYTDLVDRNVVPRMPWHDIGIMVQGSAARDLGRHFIQRWNFTKFEKAKEYDRYPWLIPKSYEDVTDVPPLPKSSTGSVFCSSAQILRSVCDWSAGIKTVEQSIHSAYLGAIHASEHYVYIENQFFITQAAGNKDVFNEVGEALYRRITRAYKNGEVFRVYVVMPLLPAFPGEIGTASGIAIHAITHWNYASICRGTDALINRIKEEGADPNDYISFYGLRNYDTLNGKLVSELVYVHSKLLIVDDRVVICGSANLNDRSLLGKRDSEIAVIITDEEFEKSVMNGEPYDAGRFACTLRRALFREHLGLLEKGSSVVDIRDPVSDQFYKEVWMKTANRNTDIFEQVFRSIPTDRAQTFSDLRAYQAETPLCESNHIEASELVKTIQGHLVILPLNFLSGEVLTPAGNTKEGLMPVSLWT